MNQGSANVSPIINYVYSVKQIIRHPLATNAGVLAASQYGAAALGFITTAVTARLLGSTDYGTAALVMAYPSLLESLVSFKSITVTTRYLARFRDTGQKEELKAICKIGYGVDFFAFILVFVLVSLTGWWVSTYVYDLSNVFWLMVLYAASFPVGSFKGTSYALLTSFQKFRWLAFFYVLDRAVTLLLVVALLAVGFRIPGMVLGIAAGHVISGLSALCVASYFLQRNGMNGWWKASLKSITPMRKELFSFFGWNYLMVTLRGLTAQGPLLLLGRLRGPEEAGFYRLAMSLLVIGSYPQTSLGRIVYPEISVRWAKGMRVSVKNSLMRWTLGGGLPLGALVLLIVPLLPLVVRVAFGEDYSPVVSAAQVLMMGSAVSALFFWIESLYYATSRIQTWTKAYAVLTFSILALMWFFIEWRGFFGIAALFSIGRALFVLTMARDTLLRGQEWVELP